jgi:hypothetical protein
MSRRQISNTSLNNKWYRILRLHVPTRVFEQNNSAGLNLIKLLGPYLSF